MNQLTFSPTVRRIFGGLLLAGFLFTGSCKDHVNPGGPPFYNIDVTLTGANNATGTVQFRQLTDKPFTIFLETAVQGLAPNTSYGLQRAVDTVIDGNCTGTAWLTLGKGLVAQAIVTDSQGAGSVSLFRDVSAFPSGTTFDINFRVINQQTSAVVLTSGCYQYTVR